MALMECPRKIGGPGHDVHIDEALFRGIVGESVKNRAIVFGMATKSDLISFVISDRKSSTLIPLIQKYVALGSTIVTDCHRSYARLAKMGWQHETVNHARCLYKNENGFYQSQIETYWGHLKRAFRATHLRISKRNLWKYIGEFNFRYNRRHRADEIFWDMISCFPPFPEGDGDGF